MTSFFVSPISPLPLPHSPLPFASEHWKQVFICPKLLAVRRTFLLFCHLDDYTKSLSSTIVIIFAPLTLVHVMVAIYVRTFALIYIWA